MDHFVIRLWVPAATGADAPVVDPGLHGVVSHVGSGRSETFRDGRELLRRLVELRGPVAIDGHADPTTGR